MIKPGWFYMVYKLFQIRRISQVLVLALFFLTCTGAHSDVTNFENSDNSLLGSYLAGRLANSQRDSNYAIEYYTNALEKDPKSRILIQQSFLLAAKLGKWDQAKSRAKELINREPKHFLARLFLGAVAFKANQYKTAEKHFSSAGKSTLTLLTSELATAWTLVAQKKYKDALKYLDQAVGAQGAKSYRKYHKALTADVMGLNKTANREYEKLIKKNAHSVRVYLAYVKSLARQGKFTRAKKVLQKLQAKTNPNPVISDLYKQIKRKKKTPLLVSSAQSGLAEVLYGLGDALRSDGGIDIAILYLQMALYLAPDLDQAKVSLANIYQRTKRYDMAIKYYESISKKSPIWMNVQIRTARNLNALERVDEAVDLLKKIIDRHPQELGPLETLGNILRSHNRFKEALSYYDKAIGLVKKPERKHWFLFYSRGVCYERIKQWDKAEVDLKKAKSLDGNQAVVLNYLGYSWVDQNTNLKEAMKLIRKAVNLQPREGYFVDSLGWAHYQLGDYQSAVTELERAVSLKPEDAVINDHLGDAYWRVGRQLEARYQWEQSLTLKPEEDVKKKIVEKLKDGLQVKKIKIAKIIKKPTEKRTMKDVSGFSKEKQPEEQERPESITVSPGDTLWGIAVKYYKDGELYKKSTSATKRASRIRIAWNPV